MTSGKMPEQFIRATKLISILNGPNVVDRCNVCLFVYLVLGWLAGPFAIFIFFLFIFYICRHTS